MLTHIAILFKKRQNFYNEKREHAISNDWKTFFIKDVSAFVAFCVR